jgi:hypothetical protein
MTSKTITGYLVDAAARTIRPVTLPFATGKLSGQMRELIGCQYFSCVRLPDDNSAWVDDEGMLNDPQHFVMIAGGYPDPLAGNVLFLGPADRAGNTVSCTATLEFLVSRVFCATVGQGGWSRITPETIQ